MKKFKTYNLNNFKSKNLDLLYNTLHNLGFSHKDFKIVHFGSHEMELKVTNKELNEIIKTFIKLC